jgi:hypothetical protein
MKRWTVLILVLSLFGLSARAELFSRAKKVYRQGDDTWVKIIPGNKSLRPFDHPCQFTEEAMDRYLASIRYFRPSVPLLTGKKGSEWDLLTAEEIAKLAPYLVTAFSKAGPDEWVDFSLGVYRGGTLLGAYRQSEGVMFVKDGELNLVFRNISLRKSPGDVTTTTDPTRGYDTRVRIVPGPGQRLKQSRTRQGKEQDRINWVIMSASSPPPLREAVKPETETKAAGPVPAPAPASARERLQELKQLYDDGLISRDEYEQKRQEILKQL